MPFSVKLSNRTVFKINATLSYIEDICYNRTYAKKLYEAIEQSVLDLETKERFRIRDQEASRLLDCDVYRINIGKYRLLYVVDEQNSTVTVFSFFHETQRFEAVVVSDFKNAS